MDDDCVPISHFLDETDDNRRRKLLGGKAREIISLVTTRKTTVSLFELKENCA